MAGSPWPVQRRFVTLSRTPQNVAGWQQKVNASIELPAGLGVEPQTAARQSAAIADHLKWLIGDLVFE